jgi:flavin-dependent dehydrogenase
LQKIAIIGAGVSGACLYRMLQVHRPEIKADIYAIPMATRCRTRSCGWGVSYPVFKKMGENLKIDLEQFIYYRFRQIDFDGKVIPADNAVIDKPGLIQKLLEGSNPIFDPPDISKYDRVIDATGKRIYLPPRPDDKYVTIHQVRVFDASRSCPGIRVRWDKDNKDMLYIIPVGDGTVHIGYGSVIAPEKSLVELNKYTTGKKEICRCTSDLWFGGPTLPLVQGKFIAVGESAGLVEPCSGMGITPAMDSAAALVTRWDNPAAYEHYIKNKYSFMSRLKRARDGEPWVSRLFDVALSVKNEYTLLGFRPGIGTALRKFSGGYT